MSELKATEDDIRAAYRLILGRDPDPPGFDHYAAAVKKDAVSTRQLCTMFTSSSEFVSSEDKLVVVGDGLLVAVDDSEPEFGTHIARDGTWEPHIVRTIRDALSPGDVFVDVGANVGVMSFNAAQVVGDTGKVIAFEPNEQNARHFLRGVIENHLETLVTVHRLALSDRNKVFALQGGSNSHLASTRAGSRLTQAVRGDDILSSEPAVHMIKLDIEGHEPFALHGLNRTLSRNGPLILCEYNPRCLQDNAGFEPGEFAKQIFRMTHKAEVIEYDGKRTTVSSAEELIGMWLAKNHEAFISGFLPDRMLHFDLLFRVEN